MGRSKQTEIHRNPMKIKGLRLKIEAPPAWIIRRKVKGFAKAKGHPVTMLLHDRQIAPEQSTWYTRYVRRPETPQATHEAERIEFDFDPATQVLLIHGISIFRDGELTNRAKFEEVEVIRRKADPDQGIYSGRITALVRLNKLRPGDIIDVESSILSDVKLFPRHCWFSENLEHPLPVGHQYFSLISKNHELFKISVSENGPNTAYTEEETEWGLLKTWTKGNSPPLDLPPLLPAGFNPFKNISISSFQSWGAVAAEIAELWAQTKDPGKDLPHELTKIQKAYPHSKGELIEAIFQFVRANIQYQPLEAGRPSLVPEDLKKIWRTRLGDNKDKVNLLCWLLQKCGFDASPALVSLTLHGNISERLPAPIFDHVVVYLRYDERDHWIDPALTHHQRTFSTWNSLPFQKALLISKETEGFKEIKQAPPEQDYIRVSESYRFQGNNAFITIRHEFHGAEAEKIRGELHSKGKTTIKKIFREKVKSTRIGAEPITELEVSDDLDKNIIVLSGNFSAISALNPNPNTGRMICDFTPYSIFEKIHGIDNSDRIFPVGLCHPTEIFHTIELDHPDAKGTGVPKTIINNEFLTFEAGTKNEDTHPTLFYYYRSKAPEVPVKDLHRYRLNLDQISSVISLVFEINSGRDSKSKPMRQRLNWDEDELEQHDSPNLLQPLKPATNEPVSPIWLSAIGGLVIITFIILIVRYAASL